MKIKRFLIVLVIVLLSASQAMGAALTTQAIVNTGLEATFTAAAGGGDDFSVDGKTFLWVKNGGGGDITVTVDSLILSNYGTDVDSVTTVTAGEDRLIGPFGVRRYGNASTKRAAITYSGVTSVTIAVIQLPAPNAGE